MDDGFDFGDEQRGAFLRVPGDVQIDFGVVVARHGETPDEDKWLKPNSEKPRERGCKCEDRDSPHPP